MVCWHNHLNHYEVANPHQDLWHMVVGNGTVGQRFHSQVKASKDAQLMTEGEDSAAEYSAAPYVLLH